MTASLTIVGLGSGDESRLTLGAWNKLQQAERLYVRTADHPALELLIRHQIEFRSFDGLYEQHDAFEAVYEAIADALISEAKSADGGEIVYALPGHPMVAEKTTRLLRERCKAEGITLEIMGGESFLDQLFVSFGFDPIEGFQLLDGSGPLSDTVQPGQHLVIAQVYDTFTASDVKLGLMEHYPDEYEVVVGHALGVRGAERIERVPLYELDRVQGFGNLSLVWVPATTDDRVRNRTFGRLREIVEILRSPGGCPWDREQTHASIRKNLIEETYEVLETIDDDDPDAMCEELGDVLLQVMLHAQIEAETGAFTVRDIVAGLNEKLIRRHPHVFGERTADNAEEALGNWQEMKREEKRKKGIDPDRVSVLAGVPRDLPALMKAYKLQKKAAEFGFDWDKLNDVLAKVEEEIAELKAELTDLSPNEVQKQAQAEELGDLLFAIVNVCRFLRVEPEEALSNTNRKFYNRFGYIEEQLGLKGKTFDQTSLAEMEFYWQEAKKVLPKRGS